MTAKDVTTNEVAQEVYQVAFGYAENLATYAIWPLKTALSYFLLGILSVVFLVVFGLVFAAFALLCVAMTTYRSIKNEMGISDDRDPLAELLREIVLVVYPEGIQAQDVSEKVPVSTNELPPAQSPAPTFTLVPAFVENRREPIIATQYATRYSAIALQAVATERPAILQEEPQCEAVPEVMPVESVAVPTLATDAEIQSSIHPVLSEVETETTKEIPVTAATKKSKKAAKAQKSARNKQEKTKAKTDAKPVVLLANSHESDIEQAIQMVKDGTPVAQAARDCGVAASTLRGRLKKLQQQTANA